MGTISITSASPAADAMGASRTGTLVVTIDSIDTVDPLSIDMSILGRQAVAGGAFTTGFAGSVVQSGTAVVITVFTHPPHDSNPVLVHITATDLSFEDSELTYKFSVELGEPGTLEAKSYCDGKRIDLSWTNPAGVTQICIFRSIYAFANFVDDPADVIYEGAPITSLSDTGLDEDQFYFYTIALSFTATVAPFEYSFTDAAKVEGLSIKDYRQIHLDAGIPEGRYVYFLLPKTYLRRDAAAERGDDQFLLRDYCDMLQCAVNLYRGWAEAILHTRDPDKAPTGRLGVASNQFGIMSAYVQDLGIKPERSFDAGVLRRLVAGIIGVNRKKGTCPGLISLAQVLTTWETRCDEAIEPVCGINRLFTLWDGESYIRLARGSAHDPNISNGTSIIDSTVLGTLRIKKTHFWKPAQFPVGFQMTNLTPNSLHLDSELGVKDAGGLTPVDLENVDTWEDQSAKGNDAVQTVDADRYEYGTPGGSSNFELRPGLENQSSSFMEMQTAGGSNFVAGQSATFFFVADVEFTAGESVLLSIEIGPLALKTRVITAAEYGFTDASGETTFGVARRFGPQAIVMSFDEPNNEAKLYIDGILEATVAYVAPPSLRDDRVTLGDNAGGPGAFFDTQYAEVFVLDRPPTTEDLNLFWNYSQAKFGQPPLGSTDQSYGSTSKVVRPFGEMGTVPLTASGESTVVSVISSLGDFACVDTVTEDADEFIFTFADDEAYIRAEISGDGTIAGVLFTITSIDTTTFPWQFPTPKESEPVFEKDALKGKIIIFDPIASRTILSNTATDLVTGETVLTLASTVVAPTSFSISDEYLVTTTYALRQPAMKVNLLVGEFSFLAEPIWDLRFLREEVEGPWSLLAGLGTTTSGAGFAPSPADVTLFVKNVATYRGIVTSVDTNSLTDTTKTQTWRDDQYARHFLLPDWNQSRLYEIAGNSADSLYLIISGAGVDTLSSVGSNYVILTPENAVKYRRLSSLLGNFVPLDSRGFVKFEEDSETFEPHLIEQDKDSDMALWLRAENHLILRTAADPDAVVEWHNMGSIIGSFDNTTDAEQPVVSTLNSLASVLFDGSDDYLTWGGVAADWNFLHNGTGMTLAVVIGSDTGNGYVLASFDDAAANTGISIKNEAAGIRVRIGNGTGGFLVDETITPVTYPCAVVIRFKETGVTNQCEIWVNGVLTIATVTGAPDAGDADDLLTMGDLPGGGATPHAGETPEAAAFKRYIDDWDLDLLSNYSVDRYT